MSTNRRALTRETPKPGQESVWDYPRPPMLEPALKLICVVAAGIEIASTESALRVLETSHPPTYYLPASDVRTDLLTPAPGRSFCEWKGVAQYWTLRCNGSRIEACAWSYADPSPRFAGLKDHLAFYLMKMDACFVGDEQARAQPGGFYGGWVTSDLAGPFKGEPGTEWW